MSIVNAFDGTGKEIIRPEQVAHREEKFPKTVIAVFSDLFADMIVNTMRAHKISTFQVGRTVPVYRVKYKEKSFGVYHSLLGGAGSALMLEEVLVKGAEKVLFFGSCGALDKELPGGRLIVPTAAYRDEGVSYHYAPASSYISVSTAGRTAEIFRELNVPFTETKTWTTDCFYRETEKNAAARKSEGCGVVEMECASIMAVAAFRKAQVYQFLYTADNLDNAQWDKRVLFSMPDDLRERILRVAFETAMRL